MNKLNNFLNTLSLLTTLIILALCYWARTGLPTYVTGFNYISIFALAATIFCLPNFLCSYFPSNKWFRSCEFYTGILIIFFGFGGIFISSYNEWINYIIITIGIILALWQLFQFARYKVLMFSVIAFLSVLCVSFSL